MTGLPSWFERVSGILVSLSLVEFTASTAVDEGLTGEVLGVAARTLRILFGLEYLVRLVASPDRWRYAVSVIGIFDLAAVAFDSGALKLLRAGKVLARDPGVIRLWRAVVRVRRDLAVTAACSGLLLYASSVAMYFAERSAQPEAFGSVPAAAWWAIVTLTTVGYGDVYPVTPGGRLITGIVAFGGLALVVVPAGIVASAVAGAVGRGGGSE